MESVLKYVVMLLCVGIFYSCMHEESCERGKKYLKAHVAYIVLDSKPKRKFEDYALIGKDLHTGRDTTIRLYGRWYTTMGSIWESGDTVIKNKGELFITVRKKDNNVYVSEWTCEDIYLNGKSVTTGMRRPD